MKKILLIAAIVLVPSLGFAFGQNKVQYKQFEWSILKSKYFDVYYYKEEEFLAQRAAILADACYDSLASTFGHELSRRTPIIIYKSQNDFQETNVTLELLGEGTGGFTEMFKNRVVVPFTGSYEELRHVIMHELTHVFSFDMLY
ncbi:MAG TPA: biopolymer transporter Tol, partial [bacterium]|nr:biopolymer transporter Tol [bacterium]